MSPFSHREAFENMELGYREDIKVVFVKTKPFKCSFKLQIQNFFIFFFIYQKLFSRALISGQILFFKSKF